MSTAVGHGAALCGTPEPTKDAMVEDSPVKVNTMDVSTTKDEVTKNSAPETKISDTATAAAVYNSTMENTAAADTNESAEGLGCILPGQMPAHSVTPGALLIEKRGLDVPDPCVLPVCAKTSTATRSNRLLQASIEGMGWVTATPRYPTGIPILFIHGDYHTGKIWMRKPDGGIGWSQYFFKTGHPIHVVDLPHTRAPPQEMDFYMCRLLKSTVENEYTCPSKRPANRHCAYDKIARHHSRWPGTGKRGDPIFDTYFSSRVPLLHTQAHRQATGQMALVELLKKMDQVVIIAEGSGCQMAWLAADVCPERVAGIVAVSPPEPPFGTAKLRSPDGSLTKWSRSVRYCHRIRRYGLADIPLSFDPPLPQPADVFDAPEGPPRLNICQVPSLEGVAWLQTHAFHPGQESTTQHETPVRKLINVQKVFHVLITAPASHNVLYDHATVAFMRQAGLDVSWEKLEERGIHGNGPLMFLETNSNDIAGIIAKHIRDKM